MRVRAKADSMVAERGTIIGLTAQTMIGRHDDRHESGDLLYSGRLTGERQIRAT